MLKKLVAALTLALIVATIPSAALADDNSWQTKLIPYDVESGIVCTIDGCNMNLAACEDNAAQTLRQVIREKMFKDGMNKDQLYAYMADTYGEEILAAPPKKGFNWVAWIMPFVATIAGATLVYLGLEKWVIPSNRDNLDEEETRKQLDPADEARLNKELKRYL